MTIRIYSSEDFGAPVIHGGINGLIPMLDACLVNGYGDQTVTITNDGTTATILFPVGHSIDTKICKMTVSGANEADYNGEHTVTVLDGLRVTYPIANSPASPATGTITCKKGGSGWTKQFSGTNKAVYTMGAGTGFSLDVNDNQTSHTIVRGIELPSGIGAGSNFFPTASQYSDASSKIHKSSSSSTSAYRPWFLVASESHFFIMINRTNSSGWDGTDHFAFGDFESLDSSDNYNCLIFGQSANYYNDYFSECGTGTKTGHYIARSSDGSGLRRRFTKTYRLYDYGSTIGHASYAYTNPSDNKVYMAEGVIFEENNTVRGFIRGMWEVYGSVSGILGSPGIFDGTGDLAGKKFLSLKSYSGLVNYEISDTY